jgi:hypothetical protein
MKAFKNIVLPVLLATIWISLSEFARNQFWLSSYWTEHYKNMGLVFPAEMINGAIWGIWALVFSILIFFISKKYSLLHTTLITWVAGFVLMWLVIGNMNVLPFRILYFAVPLSMLEVFVAAWIITKLSERKER